METTFNDFQTDVIEASVTTPIVVDFWAEWCAPCRMLSPILEKLAGQAQGRWKLVKINTEEHPEVAVNWNIRSIPAVKLFHEGQMVDEFIGVLPEPEIVRWLDTYIPSESTKALNAAKQSLEYGHKDHARKWLEQAIAQDASNVEARVLLAELLFEADPDAALDLVKEVGDEHPMFDRAQALFTLHRLSEVRRQQASKAEESDDWKMYLDGIQAFQEGRYAEALEAWIEVIRRNRQLDDDGARKACVALFQWLGNEHELTQKYRRPFSSALY